MTNKVINLLKPQVRKMLRILYIPNDKDKEIRKLIFCLSKTSK
jgi:hypothetical protein